MIIISFTFLIRIPFGSVLQRKSIKKICFPFSLVYILMNWKWNRISWGNGMELCFLLFIDFWNLFRKYLQDEEFVLYSWIAWQPQHEVFNCTRGHFGVTATACEKEADKPTTQRIEICEECVGSEWTAKVFLNFHIIHWLPPDLNISSSSLSGNAGEYKIGGHLCPFLTLYTYKYVRNFWRKIK